MNLRMILGHNKQMQTMTDSNNIPQHKSDLLMWSLRPMDDHTVLFEAGIRTGKKDAANWAKFNNGVRCAYQVLQVWIVLN
jgi:hypothetical protein